MPLRLLLAACASSLLLVAACDSSYTPETASQSRVYTRNSQYDPMVDAAPGDNRPSVPSVSGVTQEQAVGNASSEIIVPTNNMGGIGHR